jgi:predicted enzyme related to lactoylglutathione lyase
VAAKNDVAVAGITSRRPGARAIIADWATYLAVDNVDEAVRRVGEYGGTVTKEPVDAIDTARIATVLDPTGARSAPGHGRCWSRSPPAVSSRSAYQ